MKKLFWLLAILAVMIGLGILPFQSTDVAELIPAQTVVITRSGRQYTVDIGEGVRAVGNTLKDTLATLKKELPGKAFFQTAERIIVPKDEKAVNEALSEEAFRPAAEIYFTEDGDPDVQAITDYLTAHHTDLTVSRARAMLEENGTVELPELVSRNGGYEIIEPR